MSTPTPLTFSTHTTAHTIRELNSVFEKALYDGSFDQVKALIENTNSKIRLDKPLNHDVFGYPLSIVIKGFAHSLKRLKSTSKQPIPTTETANAEPLEENTNDPDIDNPEPTKPQANTKANTETQKQALNNYLKIIELILSTGFNPNLILMIYSTERLTKSTTETEEDDGYLLVEVRTTQLSDENADSSQIKDSILNNFKAILNLYLTYESTELTEMAAIEQVFSLLIAAKADFESSNRGGLGLKLISWLKEEMGVLTQKHQSSTFDAKKLSEQITRHENTLNVLSKSITELQTKVELLTNQPKDERIKLQTQINEYQKSMENLKKRHREAKQTLDGLIQSITTHENLIKKYQSLLTIIDKSPDPKPNSKIQS